MSEPVKAVEHQLTDLQSPPPGGMERLRSLLLQQEQASLQKLEHRLDDFDQRSADVAETLPEALRLSSEQQPEQLQRALSSTVEKTIFQRVRSEPETFAEALYPAILPAIRKAIHDAISSTMEQIDSMLKTRFSVSSVRWRFESMRTGTPLAAIILRESSEFHVDQVLLIQNASGLLIDHRYSPNSKNVDRDAVSGMLWAIESFVRDAFTADAEGLNRVTTEKHILYLFHGRHATLVCVVQGVAPNEFLDEARDTLANIEGREHASLVAFNGDQFGLPGAQARLDQLISSKVSVASRDTAMTRRARWPMTLAALGLIVAAGWVGWRMIQASEADAVVAALNGRAGIQIHTHERNGGNWIFTGVADPLANTTLPGSLRWLAAEKVKLHLLPVLSADPVLSLQRLRQHWQMPDSVSSTLEQGILTLSGQAPAGWIQSLSDRALPTGISVLETTELRPDFSELITQIQDSGELPVGVTAQQNSNYIRLTGDVSESQYLQLAELAKRYAAIASFELTTLHLVLDTTGAGQ